MYINSKGKGGGVMSLKIEKITDKVQKLDVKGQGCNDDCARWSGYSGSNPAGCTVTIDAYLTTWW